MLKIFLLFILAIASVSCTHHEHEHPDCTSPLVTGPCKGYFERYGFDTELGECRLFVYGGCQGNGNNYQTLQECQETCEDHDCH